MADTTAPSSVSEAIDTVVSRLSDSSSPAGPSESSPDSPGSQAGAPADAAGQAAQSPSSSTPVGATRLPGEDDDPEVRDNSVWSDLNKRRQVLANRSAKERDTYRRELESKFGFSLEDANAIENWRQFTTDRYHYIAQHYPHFLSTWVQQTRGAAPNGAGQAAVPGPPAPPSAARSNGFTMPTPGLRSEDGRMAYDADQVNGVVGYLAEQLDDLRQQNASLQAHLDPLQAQYELLEQERIRTQAYTHADQMLKEVSKWEGFEDVKGRMLELMSSDGRVTVESAYNRAMREIYLPKNEQRIRGKVLAELKTRPAVPTGPPPGTGPRASGSESRKGLTVRQALDQVLSRTS